MARLFGWMAIGAMSGAATGAFVAWARHGLLESPSLLGTAIGATIGFAAFGVRAHFQPYAIEDQIGIPVIALRAHAKWWFGRRPWYVVRYDRDEMVFARDLGPNMWVAFALLVLGVIPALLYLMTLHGRQTVTVAAAPAGDLSYLVVEVQPQGNDGRRIAGRFVNSAIDHAKAAGLTTG